MREKHLALFPVNWFDYFNVTLLSLLAALTVYPFIHIVSVSLSDAAGIASGAVALYPSGFNIDAYRFVFSNDDLVTAYYNSVRYAAIGTVIFVLVTSIVAYPLAVRSFWLNKGVMIFHVLTLFFSGGLIPTYLVYRSLGLVDTMWVIVLPPAVAVFTTVIFRTYFLGLGTELREAAHIDGANDIYILFRIYLPLSKPVVAAWSLFQIVAIWNDFFRPLLFINEEELKPLTLFLRRLLVQVDVQSLREQLDRSISERGRRAVVPVQAFQAASIIVSIVPIICIYPFIQRYFVKGALIGSLK